MSSRIAFLLLATEEDDGEVIFNRRQLRDQSNPLDLPENIFHQRFRVSKKAFKYILEVVEWNEGKRSTFISPILKLAITLEILAGGPYQWQAGDSIVAPVAQASISRIFSLVVKQLEAKLCPQWIRKTNNDETKEWFYTKFNLPGVIGAIDGTHVSLLRPKEHDIYFNRKGKHSINVMLICDYTLWIQSIFSKYGGSSHDSFIWKMSNCRKEMEARYQNQDRNSWILGDSGYPLEPWLMTPYALRDNDNAKRRYNIIHNKARSIVERTIGVLKARWRILSDDRKPWYEPTRVAEIINVSAALHVIHLYL